MILEVIGKVKEIKEYSGFKAQTYFGIKLTKTTTAVMGSAGYFKPIIEYEIDG